MVVIQILLEWAVAMNIKSILGSLGCKGPGGHNFKNQSEDNGLVELRLGLDLAKMTYCQISSPIGKSRVIANKALG